MSRKKKPLYKFYRQTAVVKLDSYAPDISITTAEYVPALSPDERIAAAIRDIDDILIRTSPDQLCGAFYDVRAQKEEEMLAKALLQQKPEHDFFIHSIDSCHRAERVRLENEASKLQELENDVDRTIGLLEDFYTKYNGGC